MGVRKILNDYSGVVAVLAVVVMIGALYQTFFGGPGQRAYAPPTELYFYDQTNGKLFVGSAKEYPPIDVPDGTKIKGIPAGVKANIFSCGKCKEGEWRIAYLETYLPKARDAQIRMDEEMERMAAAATTNPAGPPPGTPGMMGPNPDYVTIISAGHLVAKVGTPLKWLNMETPEGAAIVNEGVTKCPDGKYPSQCFPNK